MNTRPTAVILAAGIGNRLRPFTEHLPKCLVEVKKGIPILQSQLENLSRAGITKVVIVVGYRSEEIRRYIDREFSALEVSYVYNPRFDSANNFYSFSLAAEQLPNRARILQINSDVVFAPSVLANLLQQDLNKSFVLTRYDQCAEEEIKVVARLDGTVSALNKKVDPRRALGEGVGINYFGPDFWQPYQAVLLEYRYPFAQEYFEYGIEKTIERGGIIYPLNTENAFVMEIDTPTDLERARASMPVYATRTPEPMVYTAQ